MRTQLFLLILAMLPAMGFAAEESVLFIGQTHQNDKCSLEIYYYDEELEKGSWADYSLVVRSSWQATDHPPLLIKISPTRFALYGRSTTNPDQLAAFFRGSEHPSLDQLHAYSFQTWSEEGGLFQKYCRNLQRQ